MRCLISLAEFAWEDGRLDRATLLLAVADLYSESYALRLKITWEIYDDVRGFLQEYFDDQKFRSLWDEGQTTSF